MASAEKKSKSNGSSLKKKTKGQYVVCIKNEDYVASLELRKLYAVLEDPAAAKAGLRRIIDESGEDYLYPASFFLDIKLPSSIEKAVSLAS